MRKKLQKSMRTQQLLIAGFLLLVIITIVSMSIYRSSKYVQLHAPNGMLGVEVLDTYEARKLGLSGRQSLPDDKGLLFVFDEVTSDNCFWMKDMLFSIDMIWLDENKQVITVERDVSPETYPATFCPSQPAKYGLEITQGNAKKLGIDIEASLNF